MTGAPGLDLPGSTWPPSPGLRRAGARVNGRDELTEALREDDRRPDGPQLVQVPVATGMWLY